MFNRSAHALLISAALGLLLGTACHRAQGPKETILARVGDRTISTNEFITRAEYTIRPPFCKGDNYIQRKIVLNSLIAEKLYALEAGEKNELSQNEQFQLYLQGRKEQAMRQWLFNEEFFTRVALDTMEEKAQYKLAGRTYKLSYYSMADSSMARRVRESLQEGRSFEECFARYGGDIATIPKRELAWSGPEPDEFKSHFFAAALKKGEVVGPFAAEKGLYLVARVDGWTDRLVLGDKEVRQRWQDVTDKLRSQHATAAYAEWVGGLMRGKTLRFDGQTFPRVAKVMADFYLKSDAEKKQLLNRQLWNTEDTTRTSLPVESLDEIADLPFMVLDDQLWTVRDLQKLLLRHPLVFRNRQIPSGEFGLEFRNALADLVRDLVVTEAAYKKGYDRAPLVQRTVQMWQDNLLATYQRNRYLREQGQEAEFYKSYLPVIEKELNPHFVALSKKYGDRIEINTEAFEKIKLTRIDMFATEKNVPFPIVSPNFPLLTTHNLLDYGKKMAPQN
ncbi:MAG TPA: hypothetical protein PKI62_11720 [bacterium]|nr:hypothetical protein [bacterium]HPR87906.1 hypothetical protein [bacterium]